MPSLLKCYLRLALLIVPMIGATGVSAASLDSTLEARNMRFAQFNSEHGLSQDSVQDIVQDRHGLIWIATQEGLNRFDGQSIKVYEKDPLDINSLSHNWVWCLVAASDGKLWVGTDGGGISIYDATTERFTMLSHNPADANSISSNRVRALHQDQQGNIWVGTQDAGLNKIDPTNGRVTRYRHIAEDALSLPHDSILTIAEDRQGQLWIGTDGGGMARFEPSRETFVRYQNNSSEVSLAGHSVSAILDDGSGALWVGTRDAGLNRLDVRSGRFERYRHSEENAASLSHDYVRDILQDHNGTIWITTDFGLNEWRPHVAGFAHYFMDETDEASLSENRLSDLFQSTDGVLWVGSYRGVSTWNYLSDAFTHYRKENQKLSANIVTSISEDSAGKYWIGTYNGGVSAIDPITGDVAHLRHDEDDPGSISSDLVMVIAVDQQDRVWAGTRAQGLNRFDPSSGEITRYTQPKLSSNSISSLFADPDGSVWVGTYGGGLNRILLDGTTQSFRYKAEDPTSLGGDRVLVIMRDSSSQLWVGTENGGLNRFDESTQTFTRIVNEPSDPDSLSANAAWEIKETADGSLWIATKNGGLNQWRAEDRAAGIVRFKKWTKTNGLRSNTIYGLLEDEMGRLWLSSNRGVTRLDVSTEVVRHYDRRSGLIGNEFNWGARFRSRSGKLMFGGSDGLVAFVPGQVQHSGALPPGMVLAFSPLERLATRFSGHQVDDAVTIRHTDNYVAFEFSALDYTSTDDHKFRYSLVDFDDGWQHPGEARRVTYANLSPGDYHFQVQVANADGVWNPEIADVAVTVQPPPWQTVWAWLGYLVISLGGIWLIWRSYRTRRDREALQMLTLEDQVLERTAELGHRNEELEQLNERLLQASYTDSLTGLHNRRYLAQVIDQQMATIDRQRYQDQAQREVDYNGFQQKVLCFMMIDLDGFKPINDTYGHAAGDQALLQVRDALMACIRDSDVVIRWGGDEFLIVGQTQGMSGMANFVERVRLSICERAYELGQGRVARLSCSVGAVPYPFAPTQSSLLDWEHSLNLADACAYMVKANGKDGWMVVSGTKTLTHQDVAALPFSLQPLLEDEKLHMVSSLTGPLRWPSKGEVA